MLQAVTSEASTRTRTSDDLVRQSMNRTDTPPEELKRSGATVLGRILCRRVQSRLPGDWLDEEKPYAVNERHSDSIIEFHLREWPTNYRISIHSDKQCSIVGYGVFRRVQKTIPFAHDQLAKHLKDHVPGGRSTEVIWAWYREIDEPLRDFSRPETLIEVLIASANAGLAAFSEVEAEVERAMPEITGLVRETSSASVALPTLLTQTRQNMAEHQQLLMQLRRMWLSGGRDGGAPERSRLPPVEAKIRWGERSKADDALKRAGDDLAGLAVALDDWYSKVNPT